MRVGQKSAGEVVEAGRPTKAMARFLATLADAPRGTRSFREMGYPAYPMPLAMQQAGWIKPIFESYVIRIYDGNPSLIWARPKAFQILPDGRKAIALAERGA